MVCDSAGWFFKASNLSLLLGFSAWDSRGEVRAQMWSVKGIRKRTFLCLEDLFLGF